MTKSFVRLIAMFALAALPAAVIADSAYNSGTYSSCPYSQDCPATTTPVPPASGGSGTAPVSSPGTRATPTPVPGAGSGDSSTPTPSAGETTGTLPSGLEFSINVSDGQTIPADGFTVIVTPLNGSGQTFDKVEFYLNDILQSSPIAASTGTFYWRWDTAKQKATRLKVILYDKNGQRIERNFSLQIASASSGGVGISDFTRAVRQIPLPIVYGFPYLLFILLAIAIGILVWQVRREVAESERLQALLEREKVLATQKTTFIQVASHYLRTPLTLINGGLDMASSEPTQTTLVTGVKSQVARLKSEVETLLNAIIAHTEAAGPAVELKSDPITRIWLRPGFIVPLGLIATLAIGFNIIITRVGDFDIPIVDLLIQVAIFLVLSLLLYATLRSKLLRRRALKELQVLSTERAAVDQSRNQLIHDAATRLAQAIYAIKQQVGASSSPSVAIKSIRNGVDRFATMVQTFSIAEQVKTFSETGGPGTSFQLIGLINHAIGTSADQAVAKHLQVTTPSEDATLVSRDPELLQRALTSVVNNAVAYSPQNGKIDIAIQGGLKFNLLTIKDDGPGIPENLRQQLFEPFFRAEGALDFTHEGMGFSLYLDRLIMSYLGGQIQIDPVSPTKGLLVTLSLPA